jgi:hypothetical protein
MLAMNMGRAGRLVFLAVSFADKRAFQKFFTFEKLCDLYTCGEAGISASNFFSRQTQSPSKLVGWSFRQ